MRLMTPHVNSSRNRLTLDVPARQNNHRKDQAQINQALAPSPNTRKATKRNFFRIQSTLKTASIKRVSAWGERWRCRCRYGRAATWLPLGLPQADGALANAQSRSAVASP